MYFLCNGHSHEKWRLQHNRCIAFILFSMGILPANSALLFKKCLKRKQYVVYCINYYCTLFQVNNAKQYFVLAFTRCEFTGCIATYTKITLSSLSFDPILHICAFTLLEATSQNRAEQSLPVTSWIKPCEAFLS